MFLAMIRFEWRFFTRQYSFWLTSLGIFAFTFSSVAVEQFRFGFKSANVYLNSPYSNTLSMLIVSVVGMFIVVNFAANTAIRNYQYNMNEIIHSKTLNYVAYRVGCFIGTYLVVLAVSAMAPLGLFVGSLMPWLDVSRLGYIDVWHYLQPFLVFSVPTSLTLTCIYYAVALRFKSMMAAYVLALLVFTLFLLSGTLFSGLNNNTLITLIDPFALRAFNDASLYWTANQKNTELVALQGNVLFNRVFWFVASVAILAVLGRFSTRVKSSPAQSFQVNDDSPRKYVPLSRLKHSYQPKSDLLQFFRLFYYETKHLVMSPSFWTLLIIACVILITNLIGPTRVGNVSNYPFTHSMVDAIRSAFSISIIIVITFYSAEIVWREKTYAIAEIIDSSPVHNASLWLAKLLAVTTVVFSLLLIGISLAIIYQLSQGFYHVDIAQYFKSLIYFLGLPWVWYIFLAFFVQTLSPNKYLGMTIFVACMFMPVALTSVGVEHHMFFFASAPMLQYSDMNGYAWFLTSQYYYMLYWGAFAVLLAAFSCALWRRGLHVSYLTRWRNMGDELGKFGQFVVVAAIVCFISVGTIIHNNTSVLNEFTTAEEFVQIQTGYEKTYARYADMPMFDVNNVKLDVAIFPELDKLEAIATLSVTNNSASVIDKVLVNYPENSTVEIKDASVSFYDARLKAAWLTFKQALKPNESREIEIYVARSRRGFRDTNEDFSVVNNGTYLLNSLLLPTFGVNQDFYINDPVERNERGLPPHYRAPSEQQNDLLSSASNKVTATVTLSTSNEQMALAPGKLVQQWQQNGRNYYRYQTDMPIAQTFPVYSARLVSVEDRQNDVAIELYHSPDHEWNSGRIVDSTKASLNYLSSRWGDSPVSVIKVVEHPIYNRQSASYSGMLMFPENSIFAKDMRGQPNNSYIDFLIARALAKQWLQLTINVADTTGMDILVNGLAQYSALQFIQHRYGKQQVAEIVNVELTRYFRGASASTSPELSLLANNNQSFVSTNKAGIVLTRLASVLGEDAINNAILSLMKTSDSGAAQLVTVYDLLQAIQTRTPETLHDFVAQQFDQVAYYQLNIQRSKLSNTGKELRVTINAQKFSIFPSGNEQRTEFVEPMTIGVYADNPRTGDGSPVALVEQQVTITSGTQQVKIDLRSLKDVGEAKYVLLDPYVRVIDRDLRDNLRQITK